MPKGEPEKGKRNTSFLWILPLIALVTGACLCQYDPFFNQYTTRRPDMRAVAGVYQMEYQTLTRTEASNLTAIDGTRASPNTLELHSDGTLEINNLPIWIQQHKAEGGSEWVIKKFASGTGGWEIEKVGTLDNGTGNYEDIWGVRLAISESLGEQLVISLFGDKPPFKVAFGYGDPDAGYAMVFELDGTASTE
jgi:hypothetical protein